MMHLTSPTRAASSSTSRPSTETVLRASSGASRVGWYVQTPAFEFPIEPHSLLPGAHWLPLRLRRRYWRIGATRDDADEIELLRRKELEYLFGPAFPERFGPLTKSWICLRLPV